MSPPVTLLVGLLAALTAAVAAAEPEGAIEEVVVTAQRREQSLQDVPLSVSALDAEAIESRDITSIHDVQYAAPGFVFSQSFSLTQPTIRGVGSDRNGFTAEPGVAVYLDDVYLGRPYLPQAALTQIERIEILRGPQGTLYGRNTSGGALKLVSRRPADELEASASFQYGSFDQLQGAASVSSPIWGSLKGRLSFFGEDRDGYVKNLTTGETLEGHEVLSVRASTSADPFDWLALDLHADWNEQRDEGPVGHATTPVTGGVIGGSAALPAIAPYDGVIAGLERQFGVVLDPLRRRIASQFALGRRSDDPREVYQDAPVKTDIDAKGVSARARADLGFAEATLIPAYRKSSRLYLTDGDVSETPLFVFDPVFGDAEQTSVELQLTSTTDLPANLGTLRWLAGGFYFDEDAFEVVNIPLAVFFPENLSAIGDLVPAQILPVLQDGGLSRLRFGGDQFVKSYAGFTDLEWKPVEWLIARLGGRYTYDTKDMLSTVEHPDPSARCENVRRSADFSKFTARAGLDVPVDDERLVYGSFTQGFKAGGFNHFACNEGAYDPETVGAFEAGAKTRWLDGRLQLNVAGFFYTYDDIQIEKTVNLGTVVVNAAEAEIKGAEDELTAVPFERFTIDGTAGWLDAEFTDFADDDPFTPLEGAVDLSGNRLTKSPEWSGSLGAEYGMPVASLLDVTGRAEWSYRGSMYFDHFNHDFMREGAYQLWNAYLHFDEPERRYGLNAFVKNIGDEVYRSGAVIASFAVGGPASWYGLPRTWGVEVYARF